MIVVIDANVLVANPALDSRAWREMRAAIMDKKVRAIVPDFAFIEAVRVMKRKRGESIAAIEAQTNLWGVRGKSQLATTAWGLRYEAERTELELRQALRDAGVSITKGPTVSHEMIVRRATGRVRPFDDKGSGYRDTLHWFFVLNLYEREGHQHEVVLVSSDVTAFGFLKGGGSNELHPDLLRDVRRIDSARASPRDGLQLTWHKALAHVDVPDLFVDDSAQVSDVPSEPELGSGVVAAVITSAPISVNPSLTPFGRSVHAALIASAQSVAVVEYMARRYRQRPDVIALDFVADVDATFKGIGVSAPDSSNLRNLTLAGKIRATGRIDFDTNSNTFGEAEITWSAVVLGSGATE